ncbi:MAG: HAD-IA family hydrolase [Pseudomonadota bacterium]
MLTAVFDLDGTLADTSGDLIEGANRALADLGVAGRLDPRVDAGISGRGGLAMLRLGLERSGETLDDAALQATWREFIRHYEMVIADTSRFFPGAAEALDALRAEGWRLAVCTNKPERLAHRLLEALGELGRFDALVGADTLPVRKPDPAPFHEAVARAGGRGDRAIMIGDTATDRRTAEAAGVPCVLVDFGVSADDVRALGADTVIDDYADLAAALAALVPRLAPV